MLHQTKCRWIIVGLVVGEGICLLLYGKSHDFVSAYCVISAWGKDLVTKLLVGK